MSQTAQSGLSGETDGPPPAAPVADRTRWYARAGTWRLALVALVAAVLGGVLGGLLVTAVKPSSPGSCDSQAVARDVLPSVVTIFVNGSTGSGSGSGAITGADGVIVTNDHVISSAVQGGQISVLLNDGETKAARLVGTDPKTDLAVLKVDGSGLPTIASGDATALQVGQPVVALGAPLGLSGTVTSGIVSALNRDVTAPMGQGGVTVLTGSIQTDASINPGNSGGPLVDCAGRLVGINTAISTVPNAEGQAGGGSVGIGFAVPSQTVTNITAQLQASGRAAHPWVGMSTTEIPPAAAAQLGSAPGLFVQAVANPGPAAAMGLQPGDVVTSLDGQAATQVALARLLATGKAGQAVAVAYVRRGNPGSGTLTLQEQP